MTSLDDILNDPENELLLLGTKEEQEFNKKLFDVSRYDGIKTQSFSESMEILQSGELAQDVRNNTDGLSTYNVTMSNGNKQTMTRDCLLHCHLDNEVDNSAVSWELNSDSVAPKPHTCDFGKTVVEK